MAEGNKHTLYIDTNNTITLTGVDSVDSLTSGEAVVRCDNHKVVVKGTALQLYNMDSDSNKVVINSQGISSISYSGGKGKTNWKSLFNR